MSAPRILIMAGGTGGHVFPALAVADALREQGAEINWLGTRRGMEAELVSKAGYPIDFISVTGLRGKGALGWVLAPIKLLRALWQSLRILKRLRPAVVLGMGGFVTGPGGVGAWLQGLPLVIHEQNARAGLTNRLLAHIATRIFEAFPGTFSGNTRVAETGNPVRAEIANLPEPAERLAAREGGLRLLVVGGSLGAMALNETLPKALAQLPEGQRPQVRHQTGQRNYEAVASIYKETGVEVELMPFIDDMAAAYAWADLVLCRAGALTVSELAAAGVGAILVPYPHAVDDHQTLNARYLSEHGAAELLPQTELNVEQLAGLLKDYGDDAEQGRAKLLAMAEAARQLAHADAAQTVMNACLALAQSKGAAL